MSTVLSVPAPSRSAMPVRANRLSFRKHHPHAYAPWREPVSEKQINAHFEQRILPELSVLLEAAFVDFSETDCEEAVQDATCQALEAFRALKLYGNIRRNTAHEEIALVLAKFASNRYRAGVRFASPRSTSHQ